MVDPFQLSAGAKADIKTALQAQISAGLNRDGEAIRALRTHLPPLGPHRFTLEEALVLDAGGTNIRGARVGWDVDGTPEVTMGGKTRFPKSMTAERFFSLHAECLPESEADTLPLGYCFSYPAESTPDHDANVLRFTKGVEVKGLKDRVGESLQHFLAGQGVQTSQVRVLNDTVAALFALQAMAPEKRGIGLIVGTGTNMAAFFGPEHASKLKNAQALNLESGNAMLPCATTFDDQLDAGSENPGAQRFEKAVSGRYLPALFRKVHPDCSAIDPLGSTEQLFQLRDQSDGDEAQTAEFILDRSADLVACALAAVQGILDDTCPVLAEGGLFWGDPRYAARVQHTLEELGRGETELVKMDHANLIGTAAVALGV